jgi:uncharacterized protein YukE
MSIFDFMSDGVEEALNAMNQQIQKSEGVISSIRNVVAPLEDAGWVGEGADAFFEETREFLSRAEQTRDEMQAFVGALQQSMSLAQEAMEQINGITNS